MAELNDTILTATDTGIVATSIGSFTVSGEIGDNPFIANDVDLYALDLDAGDTVTFDIAADVNGSGLDSILRVFDAEGNEVAVNDDDGLTLDSLISFRPTADGSYFVGVSSFANFGYDPTIEGSGFDGFSTGDYDLVISVINTVRGDNSRNSLTGSGQSDLIFGLGGNDTIQARGGSDTVLGGTGRDWINGAAGDDSLFGALGADTLIGSGGDDTLSGGENRDRLLGGSGADVLRGQQDRDTLNGGGGNDTVSGGTGDDVLLGGRGKDALNGASGDDRLNGNGGGDRINGGSGSDTIRGGSGNDTLRGQDEDDRLFGGGGHDALFGGVGRDTLTGGTGADTFVYENARHGLDTITDFEGVDQMVLTDLVSPFGIPSFNSATPFEDYVRLVQVGVDTKVRFDVGGDQVSNRFVTLATLENVQVSSLTAENFIF